MRSQVSVAAKASFRVLARLAVQAEALDKLLLVYGEARAVPKWVNACLYGARHIREELEEVSPDIPRFESWYAPYREEFVTDPLWHWAFTARDKSEHQRDLAEHSRVRVDLIASYRPEPLASWQPGLFASADEIVHTVPAAHLTPHVQENGAVRVSRRWVDSELAGWEILGALETIYARWMDLVIDLNRHCDGQLPVETGRRGADVLEPREDRRHYFAVKDGSYLLHSERRPPAREELVAQVERPWKDTALLASLRSAVSFREAARIYFEYFAETLLRKGVITPIAIFFAGTQTLTVRDLHMSNRAHKYAVHHELAEFGRRLGADGIATIVEAWGTSAGRLAPGEVPRQRTATHEVLVLQGADARGSLIYLTSDIRRGVLRRRKVKRLAAPLEQSNRLPTALIPFIDGWYGLDRLNLPADADLTRDIIHLD